MHLTRYLMMNICEISPDDCETSLCMNMNQIFSVSVNTADLGHNNAVL